MEKVLRVEDGKYITGEVMGAETVYICGLDSSTWNPGAISNLQTLPPGVYSMTFPLPQSANNANYLVSIYDFTNTKRLAYEYYNSANKPYGCLALNIKLDSPTSVGLRLDSSAAVTVLPNTVYSNLVIVRIR